MDVFLRDRLLRRVDSGASRSESDVIGHQYRDNGNNERQRSEQQQSPRSNLQHVEARYRENHDARKKHEQAQCRTLSLGRGPRPKATRLNASITTQTISVTAAAVSDPAPRTLSQMRARESTTEQPRRYGNDTPNIRSRGDSTLWGHTAGRLLARFAVLPTDEHSEAVVPVVAVVLVHQPVPRCSFSLGDARLPERPRPRIPS